MRYCLVAIRLPVVPRRSLAAFLHCSTCSSSAACLLCFVSSSSAARLLCFACSFTFAVLTLGVLR